MRIGAHAAGQARGMGSDLLLYVVVGTALAFDFTNGFHDTANAMATSIATRALKPRIAVALSAALNFAGAFISIEVAATIAEGIVDPRSATLPIIFAALLGAIAWNLATWFLSLPSSSSHALIGGVVGATLAAAGSDAVNGRGILSDVVIPALIAPVLAGAIAVLGTVTAIKLARRMSPRTGEQGYRYGQIGSASLVSLAHGTNDAQKTMGVIVLALVAHGTMSGEEFSVPLWVKLSAAAAIALGTYAGGWRIIHTLGKRVTEIEPPQGFAAEAAGATVILASSHYGFPLSTTHVVSGGVLGSGVGRRLADVRWGIAGRIGLAWALTLPAAGLAGACAYELTELLGAEDAGPVVVGLVAIASAVALWSASRRDPIGPEAV
jgi:inorganic phosphate transporter, PiT family